MKLNLTQGGKPLDINELLSEVSLEPVFSEDYVQHQRAMDKIHSLVLVRERTQKEIRQRLHSLDFEYNTVEDAVDSAVRCGLISDERYASALIRGKVNQGWGRAKIVERLRNDGVSSEVIAKCSEYFASPEQEYQRALHELQKKSVRSKNPRATLTRRLLSKGYSHDITYRAVDEFMSCRD